MKQPYKWLIRLAAAALVCVPLAGAALASGQQGTRSDPLVTLSYLEQKATPALLEQVDAKLTQREADLRSQLSDVVDRYIREVEDKLLGTGGTVTPSPGLSGTGAAYQVVTLAAGQTITGSAACEFLLRSGTAVCVADSAPGLVDMTGGTTLPNGGALTANHLYLATIEGRGLRASTAVTLMVRGDCVIS